MQANQAATALNQTAAQLQGGILRLGIGTAIPLIATWETTLATSNAPELRSVSENLTALREKLASQSFDPGEVARLLATLGAQTQAVATSPTGFALAVPLSQLSLLLTTGGAALASQAGGGGSQPEAGGQRSGGGTIRDFEQTETVDAPPDAVFEWLADVENLPKYLPPIKGASIEGPSEEGKPGAKLRLEGEIPNRGSFENEGYFDVDRSARRLRWGAEVNRDYSGWLQVTGADGGGSQVRVHLSFGPRSVEGQIEEEAPSDRDPLAEAVGATLESIRRQIEEGAGKVQPPPPPPNGD